MKKLLFVLGAGLLAAFTLVTLWHRRGDGVGQAVSTANPERERIRRFWALYNEANALRSKGQFEQAIPLYRDCLKLNPVHEDSLYNLGTSHKELGEYAEAVAAFERLVEVNPESNRGHAELGNTLSAPAPGAVLDYGRARAAFERSVEINREQAGPFLQLGKLELNQGDLRAARAQFRIAAGFQSPEGNFLLGYTLFLEKKYAEAAGSFRKVLDTHARERAIAKRGVMSEGDILPAPGKPMTALERSATKSLLLLYWCVRRAGGYPADTPKAYRIHKPEGVREFASSAAGGGPRETCPERETLRRAGLNPPGTVTGCASADFNRDGREDIIAVRWLRDSILYLGQGDGRYSDATPTAGLAGVRGPSHGALVFDYDKDGWLDVLITAQAPYEESVRSLLQPGYRAAKYTPRLFRNKGGAGFEEVTAQAGLTRCYGTMQALAADFDTDGWTDILLINGGRAEPRLEPSVILRNVNGTRFEEWAYVSGFDHPGNFLSGTVAVQNGRTRIALTPGSVPGS